MNTRRDPGHGLLGATLVATSAVLFGVVVVLGKVAMREGLPVFSTLALRYGSSALCLVVVLALGGKSFRPAQGEWLWVFFLGAIGYAFESSMFFSALQHGTAAAVTLLFYVYPVIILAASIALGRGKPDARLLSSLGLAVGGAALVVLSGGGVEIETIGVFFALCSATAFSGYVLGAEYALRRTSPFTSSLWVCIGATVGCATFASFSGQLELPADGDAWINVAWMGIASAFAFITMLSGLRMVGAVKTSIISSMEPLAAAFLGFVMLGESMGVGTVAGGALILAGAIGASLARPLQRPEPSIP